MILKSLPIIFMVISFCFQTAAAGSGERNYERAVQRFEELLKDPQQRALRHQWIACVHDFQSLLTAEPNGPWADDALFMMGRVYAMLYEYFSNRYDKQEAVDCFSRLLKRFPMSSYIDAANQAIAKLQGEKEEGRGPDTGSCGDGKFQIGGDYDRVKSLQGAPAEVRAMRSWSSPTYARVVIDVESEVPYEHCLPEQEAGSSGPQRLLINIHHAHMGPDVKAFVPVEGALLTDARATQLRPDMVRIVLDATSIDHVKVFSLPDPFRIVVDVRSVPVKTASKMRVKEEANRTKMPRGALAKQFALGVRKIVVDPGHGGNDFGAPGYLQGVFEKNITLEVSRRLVKAIREKLGCEAILTRDDDRFLSLEERTALANKAGADLFISIHTNAHEKMASSGVETYFLNLAVDEDAILVAARENASSAKNMSDLEGILADLMKQSKQDESSLLAGYVQNSLVKSVEAGYGKVRNKGVKQAPFYVLLGAQMPSILVELAFITNPSECRRLNTAGYQDTLADGIATGIEKYIKEIHKPVTTAAGAGKTG